MLTNHTSIRNLDWIIIALTGGISALGLLAIYSANHGTGAMEVLYIRQALWLCIGVVFMLVTFSIGYRTLEKYAYVLYVIMTLMLIYVMIFGKTVMGAQRWVHLGPVSFQVSEISKVVLVLVLAKCFRDRRHNGPMSLKHLFLPAGLVLLPFALILKQPDLGTALILVLLALTMALLSGIKRRTLLFIGAAALVMAPILWSQMEDYQKVRILTMIYPDKDPAGAGYHSLQSKIAVGSGGLTGKGLLAGTQSGLNFLPEKHTDFIFAVVAEELGFFGASLAIGLYLAIIIRGLIITFRSQELLGTLIAAGVVTMLTLYVALNIAMTVGMAPVVGIPLPLMSYGGSSVVTTFISLGLLMNVNAHRFHKNKTMPYGALTWRTP